MIVFLNSEWYFFFQSLAVQGLNKWWMGGSEQKILMKPIFLCPIAVMRKLAEFVFLLFLCDVMTKYYFGLLGKHV